MTISLIIPVYNRPDEIEELLQSLLEQSDKRFEVVIVEDGSVDKCQEIAQRYRGALDLQYFFKTNSGPGLSRNYGAERARGERLVFLDSDCLLPPHYIATLYKALEERNWQVFGGPDKALKSFSPIQKAINYSMTSFLTTGGIRGSANSLEKFHPRSFNMGISKAAFKATQGFSKMRFGEDIDLSIRLQQAGFQAELIQEAYVYHKRRTKFRQFFKQVFNSGIARINLHKRHPGTLKLVHFFPATFTKGLLLALILLFFSWPYLLGIYVVYSLALLFHAWWKEKNLRTAFLALLASYCQLGAYGLGFLQAFYRRILLGRDEYNRYVKTFYD